MGNDRPSYRRTSLAVPNRSFISALILDVFLEVFPSSAKTLG
jgi:hypothetical protein